MDYIRLITFFLILSLGVTSLFIIWFLYLRFRNKLLKMYFFLFLLITGLVLTDMIDVLSSILNIGLKNDRGLINFLDYISFLTAFLFRTVLIIYVPVFVHKIAGVSFINMKKVIFSIITFLYMTVVIITRITDNLIFDILDSIIFFGTFGYSFSLLLKNKKNIKVNELKNAIVLLCTITAVFIILIFSENLIKLFMKNPPFWIYNSPSLLLLYLVWNILNIVHAVKYFFRPINSEVFEIPVNFINRYDITHREKEIIKLIAAGDYNKEISWKLGISIKTVKSHIYNIYKKINITGRISLINKIRTFQ